MGDRIIAVLLAALSLSCAHRVKTVPEARCLSWDALDARSRGSFALVSCSALDPETWDWGNRSDECSVADVRVTGKPEPDFVLDSFAEVDREGRTITLRPEPRVTEKYLHAGPSIPIGCDTEVPRVYVGNGFLGYVVAYQPDGTELWRLSLPEFQTIIGRPLPESSREIMRLVDSEGAVLGHNLTSMGPFIAARYRVKGRWYEAIIHRSGVLTALLGPWDGVLEKPTADGWTFAAGGQAANGYWKLPTEEISLRLTAKGPEPLVEHFLAWTLPQPQDTQWTWRKCLGGERFVRLDLGKGFNAGISETAQRIHDGLGHEWMASVIERTGLGNRGALDYHTWKAKIRAALLEAGADVDAMRYAREHGLLPLS